MILFLGALWLVIVMSCMTLVGIGRSDRDL